MYAFACLKKKFFKKVKKYFADSENCIIFVFGKQNKSGSVRVV